MGWLGEIFGIPGKSAFLITDPALEAQLLPVLLRKVDRARRQADNFFKHVPAVDASAEIAAVIGWPYAAVSAAGHMPQLDVCYRDSKFYVTAPDPDRLPKSGIFPAAAARVRDWARCEGLQKINGLPWNTPSVPSDRDLDKLGQPPLRRLVHAWH